MSETPTTSQSQPPAALDASAIEFAPAIERVTRDFTGRAWVFKQIDDWLTNQTSQVYLLTGDPGTGKSANSA